MNETKILKTGYLALCITIALVLPHITSVEDVPVVAQVLLQIMFVSIGLLVYVKCEEGK